jgi:hypothetical protein
MSDRMAELGSFDYTNGSETGDCFPVTVSASRKFGGLRLVRTTHLGAFKLYGSMLATACSRIHFEVGDSDAYVFMRSWRVRFGDTGDLIFNQNVLSTSDLGRFAQRWTLRAIFPAANIRPRKHTHEEHAQAVLLAPQFKLNRGPVS